MKLLDDIQSKIRLNQIENLYKYVLKRAEEEDIVWDDIVEDIIKDFDDFSLEDVEYLMKFDFDSFKKQLESIILNTLVLVDENERLKDIISNHEIIRKDEVKHLTDKIQKSIDIIARSDNEYYENNVRIKNDIMYLISNKVNHYQPNKIRIQYEPSSMEYIVGNFPDNDNLGDGTYSGYWNADIYLNRKNNVKGIITLEYDRNIRFNNINFRSATINRVNINKVKYYDLEDGEYIDITPEDTNYKKDFYFEFNEMYITNKIKIEVEQPHYDYILEKDVNDVNIIRDSVISDRNIVDIKNRRIQGVINDEPFKLVDRKNLKNKYKYELGAYNIEVFSKTFINQPGSFKTNEFSIEDDMKNVKIIARDNKPEDSEIKYRLIQDDKSYVIDDQNNRNLTPGENISIDKIFRESEKFVDLDYNKLELDYYPNSGNPDFTVKVDGDIINEVEEFTQEDQVEFIHSGKNLYFNKDLSGKVVEVTYLRKTSSLVLELELRTNKEGYAFYTPSVNYLNLEINGKLQL